MPDRFDLDCFEGRSVVATAFVEAQQHRPAALSESVPIPNLRQRLVENLAFCSYPDSEGKTLRGFYLLGSSTTSRLASLGARAILPYSPTRGDFEIHHQEDGGTVVSASVGQIAVFEPPDGTPNAVTTTRFGTVENIAPFLNARSFNFVTRGSATYIMQGVLKGWEPELRRVSLFDADACGLIGLDVDQVVVGAQVMNVSYLLRLGRVDNTAEGR